MNNTLFPVPVSLDSPMKFREKWYIAHGHALGSTYILDTEAVSLVTKVTKSSDTFHSIKIATGAHSKQDCAGTSLYNTVQASKG